MKFTPITLTFACSFALIVGCAKTDDGQPQPGNSPTTRPANVTLSQPTTNPATEPSALMIGHSQVWFPPACLRLSNSHGKIVARLYSDDPKDVLTGKETVNSFDLEMELPAISNPSDLDKTVWVAKSGSMQKQNTPYGIFLNNQQMTLQPLYGVEIGFKGNAPNITVTIKGTFAQFSNDTPNPAPVPVNVLGVLRATVPAPK